MKKGNPMEVKLNLSVFNANRLSERGMNASSVAKRLNVSRECVSKWLNGESMPKPDKLLQIGLILGVAYNELVTRFGDRAAPIVHFRRKQNRKQSSDDKVATDAMAEFVRRITRYSTTNVGISIAPLDNPKADCEYAAMAADYFRKQLNLPRRLKSSDLVRWFKLFRINLIPAFWGDEKYYGNALRIYFPDGNSTWVVLNLDSKVTDFLFWMAHEIGHSIAPSLHDQDSEDFADNFARALLFPPSEADALYRKIGSKSAALPIILATAKSWNVSPYTIYKSLVFAEERCGLSPSRLPPAKTVMGAANSHAAKETVAQIVFRGDQPSSADFVRKSEKWLETDFFKALAVYLSQNATGNPPIADLAHLLGLSPDDAYGVIRFLTQEA